MQKKYACKKLYFASLFFYAWGEPKFVLIMIASIVVNYYFAIIIDKCRNNNCKKRKIQLILAMDVTFNISILFIFKYLNFAISSINSMNIFSLPQTEIVLPIGISFFTFQAISYVVDVYRNTAKVQKNLFYVALYISFFPQLIAGPIVRYSTIEEQITQRTTTMSDFSEGVRRFLIGISKKVILANNFAIIADYAFDAVEPSELSILFAWLGSLSYTLQIFFDFSAYSDMAIGLGRMFGFKFMENFNYPYISKTVSEFWRRWHISLGMWFRDYVYFPLGGSHVDSTLLLIRNLFIVWSLTGIWHGANWTFIFWGLGYFLVLTFEKTMDISKKLKNRVTIICYAVFTFLCVNTGWVLFRADTISQAYNYLKSMIGLNNNAIIDQLFNQFLCENMIFIIVGVLYSLSVFKMIRDRISKQQTLDKITDIISPFIYISLFIISISYLVIGAYNPFIYFNF